MGLVKAERDAPACCGISSSGIGLLGLAALSQGLLAGLPSAELPMAVLMHRAVYRPPYGSGPPAAGQLHPTRASPPPYR